MLGLSRLREDARDIFMAGVAAADPFAAVLKNLELYGDRLWVSGKSYELAQYRNICVAGCGKAGARMGLALQERLGERISGGVIAVKYGHGLPLDKIRIIEAAHPVPDEAGLAAAQEVLKIAAGCGPADLLIFIVSGGGSALLPYPMAGLTLSDKKRTTELLLKSGATIEEINAIRKHISKVKGGRLAQWAAPAQMVALILSDVVGDSLEAIASGITVADSSTYADCLAIIDRYHGTDLLPARVLELLRRGAKGLIAETPKPSDPLFQNVQNVLVGNNALAVGGAKRRAQALGYTTLVAAEPLHGESRSAAMSHVRYLREIRRRYRPDSHPLCLIAGGETTVTVRGDGLGGRNQEFCLSAAVEIADLDRVVILSGGTDGGDGPTDAAGAIVDGFTAARGRAQLLDPLIFLERNDSYHFLGSTGDLLITGPTLTNVMDLQITLIA